jgi:hypothetical protein
MMFFLGTTFAGKCIVGLSLLIEFMTSRYVANIVFVQLIIESIVTIVIAFWY